MSEILQNQAKLLCEKISGQMDANLFESILSLFNQGVLVHYVRSPRVTLDESRFNLSIAAANGVSFEGRKKLVELQEELSQARKLIAELVKMGEFYASGDSWRKKKDGVMAAITISDTSPNPYRVGGKLARSVLSNNKELIEKLTKE